MKSKIILSLISLSILFNYSCKKDENSNPTASDAVKGYFKMVANADLFSSNQMGSKKKKQSLKKDDFYDECIITENLDGGWELITYLPCSGTEGYVKEYIDDENGIYKFLLDFCYIDAEVSDFGFVGCMLETFEQGPLSGDLKYRKAMITIKLDDQPDFNYQIDLAYKLAENLVSESVDEYGNSTTHTIGGLVGAEVNCTEVFKKGGVTYNCTHLQPIVYHHEVDWDIKDRVPVVTYAVKGVIKVEYIRNGNEGEFIIDYGNGEKDNIARITENGKSYEINYEELRESMLNEMLYE